MLAWGRGRWAVSRKPKLIQTFFLSNGWGGEGGGEGRVGVFERGGLIEDLRYCCEVF